MFSLHLPSTLAHLCPLAPLPICHIMLPYCRISATRTRTDIRTSFARYSYILLIVNHLGVIPPPHLGAVLNCKGTTIVPISQIFRKKMSIFMEIFCRTSCPELTSRSIYMACFRGTACGVFPLPLRAECFLCTACKKN